MTRLKHLGFSLVELMIMMGVASVLMLGIAQMMQYTAKATKSVAVSGDYISLKSSIYQALTTFNTCDGIAARLGAAHNVNVESATNYDVAHAVSVPELAYNMGPTIVTIAKKDSASNGLVIKQMRLWAISPPEDLGDVSTTFSYRQYSVRLQIDAERDASLQGGGQLMKFQPFTVDFKVLTGPYAASGSSPPATLKGCVPL